MKKIETRIVNFINRLLSTFNRKLIINNGYYFLKQGMIKYECGSCQKRLISLSDFKFQKYSYELQDLPKIESQEEFIPNEDSYEIYGWAIERKSTTNDKSKWGNSKPHKIYSSREIAIDSIIQIQKGEDPWEQRYKYEYRIKPIYHIGSTIGIRNVLISKILKK